DQDLEPPNGYLLLARVEGVAVGCGEQKCLDDDTGEIKGVCDDRWMRGRRLAVQPTRDLEALASRLGCSRMRLDTNRALTEAQSLYERLGYRDIARYNDNPYAHRWFEKVLN